MLIFLNDRVVPEAEAVVSVYDHGFLYGDGIYETMRVYRGVVFLLERHLERLRRSASLTKIDLPPDPFLREAVYATLSANDLPDAYVRVTVSRGKGPVGLDPALCRKPTVVVIAEPFRPYPESLYREGVSMIIAKTRRNPVEALDPRIKSLNFLNNIFAKMEAKERGASDAILLSTAGFIAEGTVCNIFFVRDGTLCTPSVDVGVLDGITRELVITLAGESGLPVSEGRFVPADLLHCSEVFFTNTTSEVMPVSRIEETVVPVGPVARALRLSYQRAVARYLETHPSG